MASGRKPASLAAAALLAAAVLWSYWPQLAGQFPVPVGGDSAAHVAIAAAFLRGGFGAVGFGYPPLLHIAVALAARLAGLSLPAAFAWSAPLLLLAAAAVAAWLTWRWLRSWPAAIAAAALLTFVSLQPFQIWQDGGLPDVLAGSVFLPVGLWYLSEAVRRPAGSIRGPVLAYGLMAVLVVLTHHLTTLTFLCLSLAYLAVVAAWQRLAGRPLSAGTKLVGGVLLALCVGALFLLPGQPALQLTKAAVSLTPAFPFVHFLGGLDSASALIPLGQLPDAVGLLPGWGGLLGLCLLWLDKTQPAERKALFTVWIVVLVVLSQLPALRFPVRFARELGVPLAVLAGYAGLRLTQLARPELRRAGLVVVALLFVQGMGVKATKLQALGDTVEFTAYDRAASLYLAPRLGPGDCVTVVPENRYYPYFLPGSVQVRVYPLDSALTQHADQLDDPAAAAWFASCRFAVVERIPGSPDWTGRFQAAGFVPLVSFDGPRRGTTVFDTAAAPGERAR